MARNQKPKGRSRNLEDIARKAGVSRSTVSRVVNNDPLVSDKTRRKVLAVIEEEGFSPNPVARALVTQRTNVIGVVVPQLPQIMFEDAYYFPTLLHGISRIATARGYAMLLWFRQSEEDERIFHQRIVSSGLMDGVIIASPHSDYPLIDHFANSQTPVVLVERPSQPDDQVSYVSVDNVAVAQQAVTHLISMGYKRIGTITGDLKITDGLDRFEGYKLALTNAGNNYNPDLVYNGKFTYDSGYQGIKYLLEHDVDAVFVANDIGARGVLQALNEQNIRVPEDIAIVSVDNLPTAIQVKPPLTTVHNPIEEKGACATALLLDFIEGHLKEPQHRLLPTELIIRESCGAAYRTASAEKALPFQEEQL